MAHSERPFLFVPAPYITETAPGPGQAPELAALSDQPHRPALAQVYEQASAGLDARGFTGESRDTAAAAMTHMVELYMRGLDVEWLAAEAARIGRARLKHSS